MPGTVVIIPARYGSRRFPGKPLAMLRGADGRSQSLIRWSHDAATAARGIDAVFVATDDARIADHVTEFGGQVLMTPESCANGTERCAAALDQLAEAPDIIVNFQGDAPLTPPWFVEQLVAALETDAAAAMATPVLRCDAAHYEALLADRQAGRVGGTTALFDADHRALYFSKEVMPFIDPKERAALDPLPVFHHVGVYAYRPDALRDYAGWPAGTLEEREGLEQLRFLEQGRVVRCVEVDARGHSFWELNNPEDVATIEKALDAR